MISRLLLVGLVGVLGISLPDGADLWTSLSWARTGATACACRREAIAFEPIATDDGAIDRIADELNRRSDGMDLSMKPAATVARPATVEPSDAATRLFAANDVWAGPVVDIAEVAAPARFEPIAVADVATIADELNRDAEGIDPAPAAARAAFEPIAVAEGDSSIADELNRAAEVPAIARDGDPEPTVGTAMKLTRDAALAWLNVLTKTTTEAAR